MGFMEKITSALFGDPFQLTGEERLGLTPFTSVASNGCERSERIASLSRFLFFISHDNGLCQRIQKKIIGDDFMGYDIQVFKREIEHDTSISLNDLQGFEHSVRVLNTALDDQYDYALTGKLLYHSGTYAITQSMGKTYDEDGELLATELTDYLVGKATDPTSQEYYREQIHNLLEHVRRVNRIFLGPNIDQGETSWLNVATTQLDRLLA